MKNAAIFWWNFSLISVLQFPGKLAGRNFTQIPPHIRTSNSTRLNQNYFTAILLELVGPNDCSRTHLATCNLQNWFPSHHIATRFTPASCAFYMQIYVGEREFAIERARSNLLAQIVCAHGGLGGSFWGRGCPYLQLCEVHVCLLGVVVRLRALDCQSQ